MTTELSPPRARNPESTGGQKTLTRSLSLAPTPLPAVGPSTSGVQLEEQSKPEPDPAQTVREFIALWNEHYFHPVIWRHP
ncbi:hypothetical protein B0H12DRAFT_693906 [Mycena haematopus]|nr:hypothetical protein B0H12DRAFT_693906 [Mycena haematopus]